MSESCLQQFINEEAVGEEPTNAELWEWIEVQIGGTHEILAREEPADEWVSNVKTGLEQSLEMVRMMEEQND